MPPRKRAAAKPPEPDSPADVTADSGGPVAAGLADGVKAAEEEPPETTPDSKDTEADRPTKDPGPPPDDDAPKLDACFPNGWPDDPTVTAVGCEHGSWTR